MKLLKPEEVAEMFGVTVGTIKTWAKNKSLIGIQLGASGRWRFEESEVEAYIQRQKDASYKGLFDESKKIAISPMPINTLTKMIEKAETVQFVSQEVAKDEQEFESDSIAYVHYEDEVEPIELILKMKSRGVKYQEIADNLNSLKVKTMNGKDWTKAIVENNVRKHNKSINE